MVLFAATSLTACAMPAQVNSMIGTPTVQLLANSPLKESLRVNAVSGGKDTNPLWTSQVGNPEFQEALRQSLSKQGIIAANEARYQLDTSLVELKQPLVGFDLTVASTVHYTIKEITTNRVVFDQTIAASYTANFSDAIIGGAVERLRLANEGSIRSNISQFLDQLIRTLGTGAPGVMSAVKLGTVG
jgi:hypothetical protein